ncbi:MAG TPA: hypothetical protein VD962_10375 [Rubricoccaceae bacterium]|nr:hypothetical protein [Rubricoccaceae bacterium]
MRAFVFALALALPFALTACGDSADEAATEEGAPAGDQEDVLGDGEVLDEPGEPEGNVFGTFDTDGDGFISETEFTTGQVGNDFGPYDQDRDGRISEAEYAAARAAHP